MYQVLVRVVSRYAPVITFPVAVILGFIGYSIESVVTNKKTPYLEMSIEEKREQRLLNVEELENLKKMPKTMFEKNDPKDLK
ncbi:unnamed protein product [Brachionus calyciflorus]|uniref:Small integral membrane protein 12 n=1 Tax=Brachionus calyciflorus TaxID=104777 RepID=A0A814A8Y9_9BILA|nr:unnamed protein product [Brachionus calyciflorus]